MSVIVVARFTISDLEAAKQSIRDGRFVTRRDHDTKQSGIQHHRFTEGIGEHVGIDEWDRIESFQEIFRRHTKITQVTEHAGAQRHPVVAVVREFAQYIRDSAGDGMITRRDPRSAASTVSVGCHCGRGLAALFRHSRPRFDGDVRDAREEEIAAPATTGVDVNGEQWSVSIVIDGHKPDDADMSVSARARLPRPDDTALEGTGSASLHSTHFDVVTIGKQLAVARALADLSHQLFESASEYEAITRRALRIRHRTSEVAPRRTWSSATHGVTRAAT
jgi:hypothetical protein